jgi:hypothetical protein
VGVLVGVSVGVLVGVSVGVLVGVSVGVLVGISVGTNCANADDGDGDKEGDTIASAQATRITISMPANETVSRYQSVGLLAGGCCEFTMIS